MLRTIKARPTAAAVAGLVLASATALVASPSEAAQSTLSSTTRIEIGSYTESDLALGLTINEGPSSRYPSNTGPTGLAGTITDVDVRIKGFAHERPRDVDILLQAPSGQTVVLMSDVGGSSPVAGLDLTFDDQAVAEIDPAGVPQSGTWRPSNEGTDDAFPAPAPATTPAGSLSVLNGQRADGNWALYVADDTFDYFGSISEFWIDFETSGPAAYPSSITASGLPSVVTDVDVTLTRLRHIWAPDLDFLLVGPQGQQATILSDVQGLLDTSSVDLTFDDSASEDLPSRFRSGTYRPVNNSGADTFPAPAPAATGATSLAAFNGTNPNGVWSLYVVDDNEMDAGSLDGWSLRITAEEPPTPTQTPTQAPTQAPTSAPDVDTTNPRVTSKRPAAGVAGVRRGVDVVAVLDEKARPATVTSATAYLVPKGSTRHVRATVTWSPGALRVVIDPRHRLRDETTYRVVITTEVADLAGNLLDQFPAKAGLQRSTWRFTTR